jgi:predicted RNase H-like nuclease (RuvC/YqgF family)
VSREGAGNARKEHSEAQIDGSGEHLAMERTRRRKSWRPSGRKARIAPRADKTKERTIREMTKVRSLVWVLALLVLVGFVAGCGQVSNQARQEAKKKVENKAQQIQQEAKQKVEAKKQQATKNVDAKKQELKKKVDDLEKRVSDLQKDVTELQKKINAHEQKEQEQQINQLKKALKDLKKKVETQGQQGQKEK